MEKDPTSYSLITYLWVSGLAMLGGFVSYMRKMEQRHPSTFSFAEFIGEIAASAFAGIITFWLCEHADVGGLLTAALVGISGHAGSRALYMIEKWAKKRFPDME